MTGNASMITCPDWCQADWHQGHDQGEPADAPHFGIVGLTDEIWLIVSQESGQPAEVQLFGRAAEAYEGGLALNSSEMAQLAGKLHELAVTTA